MRGNDWVWVELTEKGAEIAQGGTLRICGGRYHFEFRAAEPQRVTRAFEWEKVLKNERRGGEPLFMETEAPAAKIKNPEPGE